MDKIELGLKDLKLALWVRLLLEDKLSYNNESVLNMPIEELIEHISAIEPDKTTVEMLKKIK